MTFLSPARGTEAREPERINYVWICDGPHIENSTFEQLIYNAGTERTKALIDSV